MAYTISNYRVIKSVDAEIYLLISQNWEEKIVCEQGKEPYTFKTFEGTVAWIGIDDVPVWLLDAVERLENRKKKLFNPRLSAHQDCQDYYLERQDEDCYQDDHDYYQGWYPSF
jgi:hypothetical protein